MSSGGRSWGDRAIRVSMTVTVVAVAVVAGWVSYWHAVEVVRRYGAEQDPAIHLIPLTIDGMIYASSMAMLWSARYDLKTGWLSRTALVAGIAATLAANVLQGMEHGPLAAAIAAWPAIALVISYELTMWVVRAGRALTDTPSLETDQTPDEARTGPAVPGPSVSRPPVPGPSAIPSRAADELDEVGSDAAEDPDRSGSSGTANVADTVEDQSKERARVAQFQEQLAQARLLDAEHRASRGRPISAENLARAMKVGKTTALKLVKTIRTEGADLRGQAVVRPARDGGQPLALVGHDAGQGVAHAGQGLEVVR
ncbi:hypothetical protein GCM10010468_73710 [Actinocorallia longicatena]|uniref:DUF2637 domain-containing protein n=2 Tax=Actinocorallia longicatena TaxID=111803 RepID=A0ABP6QM16_9ACTN